MQENSAKQRQLARERAKEERKKSKRTEQGSALLVCEGECTEPYYLNGLRTLLGINPASVEIIPGQTRSNAVAVVKRAQERFEQSPRDRVFVLIDAEQQDLAQALKLCNKPLQRANLKKGLAEIRIEPIVSTPCFEVWLLQHFRYCDKPFANYADVYQQLIEDLPGYTKADRQIFRNTGGTEGLQRALAHTARLRDALAKTGAKTPATDMDKLVLALTAIAPQN